MPKMTTMEAAVRILESEGVRQIFGIPGPESSPFIVHSRIWAPLNIWSPVTKKEPFTWRTVTPAPLEQ